MMSLREINRITDEMAAKAERRNTRPKVFGAFADPSTVRGIPFIGTYRAPGWVTASIEELTTPSDVPYSRVANTNATEPYLMVDKSGWGGSNEPALTIGELCSLIRANPTLGWAVVEEGQFQVVVAAFRRATDAKPARVPRGTVDEVASAFATKQAAKCHNADTDGRRYRLHASDIARWDGNHVVFDWCGYHTPTTAAHMNAILHAIGANRRVSYARHRDGDIQTFTI